MDGRTLIRCESWCVARVDSVADPSRVEAEKSFVNTKCVEDETTGVYIGLGFGWHEIMSAYLIILFTVMIFIDKMTWPTPSTPAPDPYLNSIREQNAFMCIFGLHFYYIEFTPTRLWRVMQFEWVQGHETVLESKSQTPNREKKWERERKIRKMCTC